MTVSSDTSVREALSAIVDGEANDIDIQRVISRLDDPIEGEAIRAEWSRWHLARATMKGEVLEPAYGGFAASVSAAIRENAVEDRPETPASRWRNMWSAGAKTAVAAAVMLGVVFVAQPGLIGGVDTSNESGSGLANVPPATVPDEEYVESVGATVPEGFRLIPLNAQTVSVSSDPFAFQGQLPRSPSAQSPLVISEEAFRRQIQQVLEARAEQQNSVSVSKPSPFARLGDNPSTQPKVSAPEK